MSSKARFSSVLQRLIDAPDQATAEIRLNPAAFERSALEEQASSIINAALFQVGSMAFLLFDANGNRLAVEAPDWVPAVQHFDEIVARASRLGCNERLLSFSGNDGKLLHFLWAPRGETTSWNLPLHVRAAMQSAAADRVVLVAGGAVDEPRFGRVEELLVPAEGEAGGLTHAELGDAEGQPVVAAVRVVDAGPSDGGHQARIEGDHLLALAPDASFILPARTARIAKEAAGSLSLQIHRNAVVAQAATA